MTPASDLKVTKDRHVATIEIQRPPHNFFDSVLVSGIAAALEALDADDDCRAIVLAAQGKSFCAGADFAKNPNIATLAESANPRDKHLYKEAVRIFRTVKPIIAAVHGAAIGGGLGLACAADFRVTCAEAHFSANFTRLGLHPGFGLTDTLPTLLGVQRASLLLYSGRRIGGAQAVEWGLADVLAVNGEVRNTALALAHELAESAPLALQSTRQTLRRGLADRIEMATERECIEQEWLRRTEDFIEGIRAASARRPPLFQGR
jgi:enoyl-CoA hydratase/carnithine racemase